MLYMVELRYSREHRDAALQYFWEHGATHYEGDVTLRGAWVATQDHVGYALVDAANADGIAAACKPLEQFGSVSYRQVSSVDVI
jgi:hypothetical protein